MGETNRKSCEILMKFYSEWMYLARSIRLFQQSSLVLKCVKTSAENEKRTLKWQYYKVERLQVRLLSIQFRVNVLSIPELYVTRG